MLNLHRSVPAFACAVMLAVGAASARADQSSLYDEKQHADGRISSLQEQIEQARAHEGVLTTDIQSAGSEVQLLQGRIAEASSTLSRLESELAARRAKLAAVRARLAEQTRLLEVARRQYKAAQARLEARLVELYQADEVTGLEILLQAESLGSLLEQVSYFNRIGENDRQIALQVEAVKTKMRAAKMETASLEEKVAREERVLATKTAEQLAVQSSLVAERDRLASAREAKEALLASVREQRASDERALEASEAESAALAGQIAAAQAPSSSGSNPPPGSSGGAPSSSGFVWPVSGTITSGFGPRWGRMHEGLDIAAPNGSPIRAAAAGSVIVAGWSGGYGNLVVIDHGNGLATAYAHMSSIYVGGGSVSQGATIGAVGSTGNSTGNHLHFEVRQNGQPVNPLGFL